MVSLLYTGFGFSPAVASPSGLKTLIINQQTTFSITILWQHYILIYLNFQIDFEIYKSYKKKPK